MNIIHKFLINVIYYFKVITTRDYSIISEELEYGIDHDMKYNVEDNFWLKGLKIVDSFDIQFSSHFIWSSLYSSGIALRLYDIGYSTAEEYTGISNSISSSHQVSNIAKLIADAVI